MSNKVCLITGVGPGTGTALVKQFAKEGYQVAMLARNEDRLKALEAEVDNTKAFICDVSNFEQLTTTLDEVKSLMGVPDVLIHNAVGGTWGDFLEIKPEELEMNFQINTMGLLHLARHFGQDMIDRKSGVILATGNTSAYRGKSAFAGFAPSKAAQRILAESMARRLGPDGIHVAYIAIDAVIDLDWTRLGFPDKDDDFFCKPEDIASECYRIAQQPKSAWSFNVEIRPFGENW